MKQIALVIVFCLSSTVSVAASHQFFYQAEKGEHVLTPQLSLGHYQLKIPTGNSSGTLSGFLASYEYGFLNFLSAGATLTYSYQDQQRDNNDDYSSHGISNPILFIKGRQMLSDTWTLRFGLLGSISLEPTKTDTDFNQDNQYNGRNTASPYIGVEKDFNDRHRGGLKLSQDFLIGKDKTEFASATTSESEGGESTKASVFYEFHSGKWLAGGSLEYWYTNDYEHSNGSRSEVAKVFGYTIFANYQVNKMLTLIPEVQAYTILDNDINGTQIDSYALFYLNFSARFTF